MQPLDLISKKELVDLLEIIHQCTLCNNPNEFHGIIKKACSLLSANSAILCEFLSEKNGLQPIRVNNVNFPEEWVELYAQNELWKIDPIMQESCRNQGLQYWHNTYAKFGPQPEFLSCAEDVGLKRGFTFTGWQSAPKSIEILSLAGNEINNSHQTNLVLERLAPHLFMLLKRLTPMDLPQQPAEKFSNLTPREREVLNWIKEGKTSWEVSIILSISERTVNFHIRNIKGKLNAVSRGQAVAQAISQGIAYSTDLGHLFHAKPATHSRGSRPVCRSEATLLNCF